MVGILTTIGGMVVVVFFVALVMSPGFRSFLFFLILILWNKINGRPWDH